MNVSKIRTNRRVQVALGAFALAAITGGATAAFAAESPSSDEPVATQPKEFRAKQLDVPKGVTADGRTYGSGANELRGDKRFDLVSVVGDHGKLGYADRAKMDALIDDVPPSKSDELRQDLAAGRLKVDVYAEDGVTKIDTFTLGADNSKFASDLQQSDSR